jgi:hypothetical protein
LCKKGSEKAYGSAQNAKNGFGFDFFLERYHKDGDEFLNHIVRVTDDETWLSFVNAETNEQSMQWMNIVYSPNKQKNFKQTLSAYQKADGNCFLGQERSADGGIHATRDHNNVTRILRNIKKKYLRPFITKGMEC